MNIENTRRMLGVLTQRRLLLGETNASVLTGRTPQDFFNALFVDAKKYSDSKIIGIKVYTGLDLAQDNIIGSTRFKPKEIYTDGSFKIVPLFPEIRTNESRKIQKVKFNDAKYVGWISQDDSGWPVYSISTKENADYLRDIIKDSGLKDRIQAEFIPYFRKLHAYGPFLT